MVYLDYKILWKKMSRIQWFFIVVCMISMGFFQEWVKVNINFTLEQAPRVDGFYSYTHEERSTYLEELRRNRPFDYYHSHYPIKALQYFNEGSLRKLKWVMTVVFVGWFYWINRWLVSKLIKDPRGRRWLLTTYVLSFIGAFIIYTMGWVFGSNDLFYNISRKMVGALQSPVPLMMNWAGWQLYVQQRKQ